MINSILQINSPNKIYKKNRTVAKIMQPLFLKNIKSEISNTAELRRAYDQYTNSGVKLQLGRQKGSLIFLRTTKSEISL